MLKTCELGFSWHCLRADLGLFKMCAWHHWKKIM